MVVKFTQVGTNLILENKESLVQFSKNTPWNCQEKCSLKTHKF